MYQPRLPPIFRQGNVIFMSHLPKTLKDEDLILEYSKYGQVIFAHVDSRDGTGQVQFSSVRSAAAAEEEFDLNVEVVPFEQSYMNYMRDNNSLPVAHSYQAVDNLTISLSDDGSRQCNAPRRMLQGPSISSPIQSDEELALKSLYNRFSKLPTETGKCLECKVETSYTCMVCGKHFCSRACQSKNWPIHKNECKQPMPPLNFSGAKHYKNFNEYGYKMNNEIAEKHHPPAAYLDMPTVSSSFRSKSPREPDFSDKGSVISSRSEQFASSNRRPHKSSSYSGQYERPNNKEDLAASRGSPRKDKINSNQDENKLDLPETQDNSKQTVKENTMNCSPKYVSGVDSDPKQVRLYQDNQNRFQSGSRDTSRQNYDKPRYDNSASGRFPPGSGQSVRSERGFGDHRGMHGPNQSNRNERAGDEVPKHPIRSDRSYGERHGPRGEGSGQSYRNEATSTYPNRNNCSFGDKNQQRDDQFRNFNKGARFNENDKNGETIVKHGGSPGQEGTDNKDSVHSKAIVHESQDSELLAFKNKSPSSLSMKNTTENFRMPSDHPEKCELPKVQVPIQGLTETTENVKRNDCPSKCEPSTLQDAVQTPTHSENSENKEVVSGPPPVQKKVKDCKTIELKSGSQVVVSCFKGTQLFVRPVDLLNLEIFDKITCSLAEHCRSAAPLSRAPGKRDLLACKYTADGNFYRASVEDRINNPNRPDFMYTVRYVDFGNKEDALPSDMVLLTRELAEIPLMAVKTQLRDVDALSLSEEASNYLNNLFTKEIVLTSEFEGPDGHLSMELKESDGSSVNQKIRDLMGLSVQNAPVVPPPVVPPPVVPPPAKEHVENAGETNRIFINDMAYVEFPLETKLDVVISHVHPQGMLMCQPYDVAQFAQLAELTNEIMEYAGNSIQPYYPEDGEMVIVKWAVDNLWYRGVCITKAEDGSYEVMFVDHGNCDNAKPEDIRPMTKQLAKMPQMAIACFVQNLELVPILPQLDREHKKKSEEGVWVVSVTVKQNLEGVLTLDIPELLSMFKS